MIKRLSILFAALALLTTAVFAQCPDGTKIETKNRVVNGDFSMGNYGFYTQYKFNMKSVFEEGTYSITNLPKFVHNGFMECADRKSVV